LWKPKSNIPIGAKDEISPKGFYTRGVKAFSICPKFTNKCYGLVLAPRLTKRIPLNLGSQFATLLGTNVPAFINMS
jgi:hypothetical protein